LLVRVRPTFVLLLLLQLLIGPANDNHDIVLVFLRLFLAFRFKKTILICPCSSTNPQHKNNTTNTHNVYVFLFTMCCSNKLQSLVFKCLSKSRSYHQSD
jgi:hypothetical protein